MAQASNKSIRRWRIEPDQWFETSDGNIPYVSDEALMNGLLQGVPIVQAMGGKLVLHPERRTTDLPGEGITTRAIVEWVPHVNATIEPEPTVKLAELPDLPEDDDVLEGGVLTGEEDEQPEPVGAA